MKSNPFTVSAERRPLNQRITPLGWFLIVFAVIAVALLVYAGINRFGGTAAAPVQTATPTAAATALPTLTMTTPATPTSPSTPAFPATWTAGMYQDAKGQWWPAPDQLEQVQKMIEEQYRECTSIIGGNDLEVYNNVKDADVYKCYSGKMLEGWFTARKKYLDTGLFNERSEAVTEQLITVQGFSQDGLTCVVGETYLKGYLLTYNPQTKEWDRTDIPENGILNGTQYMGVAVTEMKYDPEDGRWKMNQFVKWIPRP